MLFTELLHAIHPHLMKDAEVPDFMRDLIQRFCDIPEEEWSTKKDPSSDSRYKDASLAGKEKIRCHALGRLQAHLLKAWLFQTSSNSGG